LLSRLEGLALRFENIADIDVGRAVVGPERERLFVARNRLIGTTKPRECVAAIVVSFGIIRLVCDGMVKAGDGLGEFSCGAEDDTEVIVRLGKIGPEFDRTTEQVDRIVASELVRQNAETMELAGVARLEDTGLPIAALGVNEPAGTMMLDRCCKLIGGLLLCVHAESARARFSDHHDRSA